MLKQDNYLCFAIVCGFFIGVVCGLAKFDEPELMILWTILSTVGIYLITILCISLYYVFVDSSSSKLHKEKLEENLEYYRKEFDKKEQEVQDIRNFIRGLENKD